MQCPKCAQGKNARVVRMNTDLKEERYICPKCEFVIEWEYKT